MIQRRKTTRLSACTIAALIFFALTGAFAQGTKPAKEKAIAVKGRVLTDPPLLYLISGGAGLGPLWSEFLFGIESPAKRGEPVVPIKVMYAYYDPTGKLLDEFFDHSKVYEFRLERDTTCDETVASISEAKDKGARGAVPEDLALHILKGAPKELLRPDRMLPCYTLRQGKYKLVSQDKQQSAAQPVIDPATGDLHLQLPIAPTQTKQ